MVIFNVGILRGYALLEKHNFWDLRFMTKKKTKFNCEYGFKR